LGRLDTSVVRPRLRYVPGVGGRPIIGITSYAQGASSVAEARGAGLEAWLEIQPP